MQTTVLVAILSWATTALGVPKTFFYDEFDEDFAAALNSINGQSLATQPGFVQGEAIGQVYRPAPEEFPLQIEGVDLIFSAPPSMPDLTSGFTLEIYISDEDGPDPGNSPIFAISNNDLLDPATQTLGITVQGGVGIQIAFDFTDPENHPPLITSGNIWVMVRFDQVPSAGFEAWGTLDCLIVAGLTCGCQNVGSLHDSATRVNSNVIRHVTPLGQCSGAQAWSYTEDVGISGDVILRMRADVANVACVPDCNGKVCGDDGCGDICGACAPGQSCDAGACVSCIPQCDGKTCGPDGCGGVCGTCAPGQPCLGQNCCAPMCDGIACGGDGCGGVCGTCAPGESCDAGVCNCVPDCAGVSCGDDGCGGSCGECGAGESCESGSCACVPTCGGAACGDDGCGGTCGSCADGEACEAGVCETVCVPSCEGAACGDDGCGGDCGLCNEEETCVAGECVADCVPDCTDAACGDDGCGGSCGTCGDGATCTDGVCGGQCAADCDGRDCGDDGCGGSCGSCSGGTTCSDAGTCDAPVDGLFIDAISPDQGTQGESPSVSITGGGFEMGAVVRIGGTDLVNVDYVGAGLITGVVSAELPVGLHDVIVSNPDGEVARLDDAFQLVATPSNADSGCGCQSGPTPAALAWFGLVALVMVRRRSLGGAPRP